MRKLLSKTVVDEDVWFEGLNEMFKCLEIQATKEQQQKLFFYIISTIGKYFRDNSDCVLNVGHFKFERKSFFENRLFSVEINDKKKMPTAEHAYSYYTNGGWEYEKLNAIIEEFINRMVEYSDEQEKAYNAKMAELKRLERSKRRKKH